MVFAKPSPAHTSYLFFCTHYSHPQQFCASSLEWGNLLLAAGKRTRPQDCHEASKPNANWFANESLHTTSQGVHLLFGQRDSCHSRRDQLSPSVQPWLQRPDSWISTCEISTKLNEAAPYTEELQNTVWIGAVRCFSRLLWGHSPWAGLSPRCIHGVCCRIHSWTYFPKVSISVFFLELCPEANLRHPHEGYYITIEIVHVLYVKTLNLTAASLPYTLGKIFLPSPT